MLEDFCKKCFQEMRVIDRPQRVKGRVRKKLFVPDGIFKRLTFRVNSERGARRKGIK